MLRLMGFQTRNSTCEQRRRENRVTEVKVKRPCESSHNSHTSGKRTDMRNRFEMCVAKGHVDLSRRWVESRRSAEAKL